MLTPRMTGSLRLCGVSDVGVDVGEAAEPAVITTVVLISVEI